MLFDRQNAKACGQRATVLKTGEGRARVPLGRQAWPVKVLTLILDLHMDGTLSNEE